MNETLTRLLANVFGMRETEVSLDLKKDDIGNWDSLRQMDLVTSLEREFNIVLELDDIVRINSFGDIVTVLTEKGLNVGN